MATIVRNILAFFGGAIIGSMFNLGLIIAGSFLIPPPAGVDPNDVESVRASIHLYEAQHFAFPFLAHALGTLAGAFAAYVIAGSYRSVFALVIGLFFLAGGVTAAFMIPAPWWFILLDLVIAYVPMALLGAFLGKRFVRA